MDRLAHAEAQMVMQFCDPCSTLLRCNRAILDDPGRVFVEIRRTDSS